MLKIAHRGNTKGPSLHENQIWYIQEALDAGYDAEIDVWMIDGKLWSGHNSAQYLIPEEFLWENTLRLWIHCKNFEALDYFAASGNNHNYFWHEDDKFTLTSQAFVWTYPGNRVGKWSVIVDLEGQTEYNAYAICSDYLKKD